MSHWKRLGWPRCAVRARTRPQEDQIAYLREEQRGLRATCLAARSGPARSRGWPRRPAPSPRVPRPRAGPYSGAWAQAAAHHRGGVRPLPPSGPWLRAGAGGPRALTRCRVARGGGAARCAGRRIHVHHREMVFVPGAQLGRGVRSSSACLFTISEEWALRWPSPAAPLAKRRLGRRWSDRVLGGPLRGRRTVWSPPSFPTS